ncbi:hypothetical protein PV05_11944 [Exophiala xenobiotica]|uniref:Myb-like domain-containing protein n=1 Tax=Exophiala xenobiotica TaxID=348802 RepID=A0A0D2E4J0_9EURO|nr:uncharacterized protein PV05_11944 [Exophiala xenobiotica]KIW50348.1 hypothetical protein PV05_11944 [Exophiala xenobiotica]
MSTFSSVVRKPGQKITPKTAPRRNVQRSSGRPAAAPPSLTPESQTASPAVEPVEERANTQEPETAQTQSVLESTEIPSSSQSIDTSLPLPAPLETTDRELTREATSQSTDRAPSVSVEVIAPSSTNTGISILHPVHKRASQSQSDAIPTITSSTPSVRPTRRLTNELTPATSEEPHQENDNAAEAARQSPTDSRKRRKVTHSAQAIEELRSRTTPPPLPDDVPLSLRTSPRHRRSESRTSEVLLQDATNQAAAVSELANSIEERARSLRSLSARPSHSETEDNDTPEPRDQDAEADAPTRRKRSTKKQTRAKRIQDVAQQVVEDAVGAGKINRQKSRLPTPDNAEDLQIDPEEVSMSDLTRDNKVGKKSETEKRMQENWADIQQRRKEEVERRRQAASKGRGGRQETLLQDAPVEAAHVPQQIVVNGQIVVVAESREVAYGAGVEQAVIEDADVALEDDRIYKYVNQGTLGKHAGQSRRTKWDDEQTELFYKGLRMFGTDFAMIANLFPALDRKQIKSKFIIEERANPVRVKMSVAAKEAVNLEEYAKMANQEFEDPEKVMAELAAEEKRLREEDERRRAGEGYVLEGADVPLPSTERDADGAEGVGDGEGETAGANTDRRERISALADSVVGAAVAPKKRQPQQRRTTKEPAGRGRQAKKAKRPTEGVEERLGPIDEVGR